MNVDHQLLRSTEDGYYIETPKTDSGFRQVPMSAAAYEAFERVLKKRRDGRCIKVDGYKDFLFLNRDGLPKPPSTMTPCSSALPRSTTSATRNRCPM